MCFCPWPALALLAVGLAGLWYVQGISPANIVLAIPAQQLAVVAPLAMLLWWQRVNVRKTFSLYWPGTGSAWPSFLGGLSALLGGILTGGGLFIIGAAVLLQLTSIEMSPAMKQLSEKVLDPKGTLGRNRFELVNVVRTDMRIWWLRVREINYLSE